MADKPVRIVCCANLAWNLVNFRAGLIRDLRARGFEIIAVAPHDPAMEVRLAELGCTFEGVKIDASGLSPLRDFVTFLAFLRICLRYRPAVWLSWTIKPNVYGSLAARLAGAAAFPNVSGLGTAFIRRNLLTRLVTGLYRIGFAGARRVFFQNADDRDLFVSLGMVRQEQAALLPGSGIDTEHWRDPGDAQPFRRRLLMIARVVADKGVREFVEAARIVRRTWPDARFALMGPLDVDNRTAISRAEVEAWQAEDVIEYVPPTGDPRPAIAEAGWIVLPSYREGLSRVLLEACAMGRPIVTTDVPGCRDVVTDGRNGFLCEARNAPSLAEAMARACACDEASWQAMATFGRERALHDYSQDRVTKLYLQALEFAEIA